jgi:glucose/arabinose dehydrogenase
LSTPAGQIYRIDLSRGPIVIHLLLALALQGADDPPPKVEPLKPGAKGSTMDYGPFLASTVSRVHYRGDKDLLALKGLTIKVGEGTVCYDLDLLRVAGVWTDGFLDLAGTHLVSSKGAIPTTIGGKLVATTQAEPGWSTTDFRDPRAVPSGPLPREWARWKGLYRHGRQVVLSYAVGDVDILELPGWRNGLTRTFRIGPTTKPLLASGLQATIKGGPGVSFENGVLRIAPHPEPRVFALGDVAELADPAELVKGGPALWTPVETKGARGDGEGAYVVDTLTLPDANPWGAWMRLTGLDFLSDGRIAVCTWSGDVWIASGPLEKLEWRRFATGLYEPLGLCVRKDVVYVLCRDQITELHDLNGDGEADWYRSFNNDTHTMASYHAFAFELHADAEGNFYYISDGQRVDSAVPLHGALIKVSKDGTTSSVVATGLRAANGMSVGPNGEITCADNQGNWVPSSRLNWVQPGGFYGFMPHHGRSTPPAKDDPPLCWLPHQIDNSSGGQVWVTSDQWGPFKGHLLHTSYGTASLFHVVYEKAGDVVQGGVVKLPLAFASGVMRGRFHPKDGQLYLAGLRGWQTAGARDGALQRVRYTGKPANTLLALKVVAEGLALTFTDALQAAEAANLDNWSALRWNYLYSEKYGSDDYWVSNPKKKGREPVEIASAQVSADGRTVTLKIADFKPAMQMLVRARLQAADGAPVSVDLYHTVTRVP